MDAKYLTCFCSIFAALTYTEDIPLADGTRTTEFKGSVFLLPTVSEEEAKSRYPGYHTCDVPSGINYLRLVSYNLWLHSHTVA
eukprot:scaffold2519_cov168-Amphora_coffeaeformis.AAC.2